MHGPVTPEVPTPPNPSPPPARPFKLRSEADEAHLARIHELKAQGIPLENIFPWN